MFVVIGASMLAGYAGRRLGLVPEVVARWLMTGVAAFGYATISLLSIWVTPLSATDALLPAVGAAQMLLFAFAAIPVAACFTREPSQRGLLSVMSSIPNTGLTMGGFVIYLLYGAAGLGLANIYVLTFSPMVVLLAYPIARHYAGDAPRGSLGGLMVRSLLDWRSISLPISLAGVGLSVAGVPRPAFIDDWHIMDLLVYALNVAAYFSIGLRLHLGSVPELWRMIGALGAIRFGGGAVFGLAAAGLLALSPWPLESLAHNVLLIQSFVPTGVTSVAVANMFNLRPREASVLLVVNTVMYLALVLPVVLVFWK